MSEYRCSYCDEPGVPDPLPLTDDLVRLVVVGDALGDGNDGYSCPLCFPVLERELADRFATAERGACLPSAEVFARLRSRPGRRDLESLQELFHSRGIMFAARSIPDGTAVMTLTITERFGGGTVELGFDQAGRLEDIGPVTLPEPKTKREIRKRMDDLQREIMVLSRAYDSAPEDE
jgi:hypothetical protein